MYHEDWFMRQIQLMVQALARIIFNKNDVSYEILDETNKTQTDKLYLQLTKLLDEGKINEAEDLLFENLDRDSMDYLALAIDFYKKLNEFSDNELEQSDFSREEIETGLDDIKKLFGINF